MNISIKREQNNARISSAEREKFGAKLKTKTIFKALAMTMLMPTMLLTTACSNEDDFVNNSANTENTINKGYALPVTVNVSREGDATRATYTDNGDGTGSLAFGTGDQLFVSGSATGAGSFAGALDYVPATGKFSGTIYTQNNYDGSADALFSAASSVRANLLPAGYESYNFLYINNKNTDVLYDDVVAATMSKAFVASETAKKTGVEQLSWEQAYTYSSGFALAPANAVLNFTISGLEAGEKAVTLNTQYSGMNSGQTMSGSVTPNASGVATFAIGVPNNLVIKNEANNLTIGSSNFTLPGNTALAAGKIYNITRGTGATVDLSKKNADYTAQNGETLTGTLGNNVKISIADGATVILNNVNINGSGTWTSGNYAGITCEGDATIILSGTNTVKGFYEDYPGIFAAVGKTLTIKGPGTLNVSSNGTGAAGIGGGEDVACGNIVISGGTITATHGIGGGEDSACGNIVISGGTITATGGENAAGIGSGQSYEKNASCGNITISGGTITAKGGDGAAGIGSGQGYTNHGPYIPSTCGAITITSGVTQVTATKGTDAPNSIGSGNNSTCGTITFGATQVFDGSAWSTDPMAAGTYGGLNLAISGNTWTLTPAP